MKNLRLLSILTLFLVILSLGFVESESSENIRFYHEFNTNLTIKEKCRVDGEICGSGFTCNLTILEPNQDYVVNTVPLIGTGTYRTFDLNESQTVPNGIYETTVDCGNSTTFGSNTFFYQITPDGSPPIDTGQSVIYTVSMVLLMLIICFLVFVSTKLKSGPVALSMLSFSVLLMVFAVGFSLNLIELSFGTFSGIINNYSTIYVLFITLIVAASIGLLLYLIFIALNFYWSMRGMEDRITIGTQ